MKIVMFSINPLFPDKVTGGASRHLYHIAQKLGEMGHTVKVLCAHATDSAPFYWSRNVKVEPVLPFHLPFPQPYAISGADLSLIVSRLGSALTDADRFYMHDGEFLIGAVHARVPTVVSFRDNIYPESVLGTFLGQWDDVICVSAYSADVIRTTAGRFYSGFADRLHQINNGIDLSVFRPVDPGALQQQLHIDPHNHRLLLHPHRPEPGKGLPETIRLVDRMVNQDHWTDLSVIVPEWIPDMQSRDDTGFYAEMTQLMDELGVREYFKFIPWIKPAWMPALYSLAEVTLCLGNIVEAFGNVAYESLACGTPSLVSRVGVHRTLLPDDLIDKVDFGSTNQAVKTVEQILRTRRKTPKATLAYMEKELNFDHQIEAYAEIILNCEKRASLEYQLPQVDGQTRYRLAPWCYTRGDEIFHDFRGGFETSAELIAMLNQSSYLTRDAALQQGIDQVVWQDWIDKTYIVQQRD